MLTLTLFVCLSPAQAGKPTPDEKAAALVENLGDDAFAQREAARSALLAMGEAALPVVRKAAAEHADLEVRTRSRVVLRGLAELRTERLISQMAVGPKAKRDEAARDLTQAINAKSEPAEAAATLDRLARAAEKHGTPSVRREAQTFLDAAIKPQCLKLIEKLGDDAFAQREGASQELFRLGRATLPHLRRALTDPDLEVRNRAKKIIAALEAR